MGEPRPTDDEIAQTIVDLAAERDQLAQLIDRVRALHYQVAGDLDDDDRTWCNDCDVTWPCNTIRALGDDGGES